MNSGRQAVCWGALPRRQRRLPRSSSSSFKFAFLAPALGGAAAFTIYLGYFIVH
jgi:hypothetical protein